MELNEFRNVLAKTYKLDKYITEMMLTNVNQSTQNIEYVCIYRVNKSKYKYIVYHNNDYISKISLEIGLFGKVLPYQLHLHVHLSLIVLHQLP